MLNTQVMPVKESMKTNKQTNKKIHVIPTRTQRNRWRIVCLDWYYEVIIKSKIRAGANLKNSPRNSPRDFVSLRSRR